MLSTKLKHCDTNKVLPNVIYSFGNSNVNIEGVNSSHAEQFLTVLRL